VELLESHLASFLHLCLVFTVLAARLCFYLVGDACATRLELHFSSENPFWCNLILSLEYEAWDADLVVILLGVTLAASVETVQTVVFKRGQHFTVAADAPLLVVLTLRFRSL